MGRLERELAQRRGRRKVDAMKQRTRQMRRRVAAAAIVAFALLWTAVFVQMATGNDPSLGTGSPTRSATGRERGSGPQRHSPPPAVPPTSTGEDGESAPIEQAEAAALEAEVAEAEAREAAALEAEAEARELEELEPLTTGQS